MPPTVALKFLPTGTMTPRQLSALAEMVQREIRVHERLAHHRVVRLYECLTVDDPRSPELDGCCVLVMELGERSLEDLLHKAGGVPLPEAPRLIAQVCEGLAHLHHAGWVHGDLKPSNILLMPDGSVRLADFGLTAELDSTHAYLTPAGSPDYLPPERWTEPLTAKGVAVRPTSDVWALGVTACRLLTGTWPFPGGTPRARAANAAEYAEGRAALRLPSTVPSGWRSFVEDCLAPDHASRARWDAASLRRRADTLVADPDARVKAPRSRRRTLVAAVTALTLTAGGAIGAAVATSGPEPTDYSRYFSTNADIPPKYYDLIVQAGTTCDQPGVTPAVVAALLKGASNWDANLSDPANHEYGIARWSPGVLWYYMPVGQQEKVPDPPFPPSLSIPAVGRYLCKYSTALQSVHGDRGLLLAAAFESSDDAVRRAHGIPAGILPYMKRVEKALDRYRPKGSKRPVLPTVGTPPPATDAPPQRESEREGSSRRCSSRTRSKRTDIVTRADRCQSALSRKPSMARFFTLSFVVAR